MAKIRAYLRVAKGNSYRTPWYLEVTTKENVTPLAKTVSYNNKEFLPTVAFAVDLNIPDELFSKASRVIAEINVGLRDAVIATEVAVPAKKK